jgi:serine/threonine-protein kinase
MEYLRGESLAHRLKRGVLTLDEVQTLVVQVGSALYTAHRGGVVHRDLKPENLFLVATPTGVQVKVLDFGISKLVGSNTLKTSDSIIIGTPQYMSPEQASAEHDRITGQSDLFSLATVCFEALTGRNPFAASTLARVVYLVAIEPSPSLRAEGLGLPGHVIDAVDRALAKQPEDRQPDVAAFVQAFSGVGLGGATAGEVWPVVNAPASAPAAGTPTTSARAPRAPSQVATPQPPQSAATAQSVGQGPRAVLPPPRSKVAGTRGLLVGLVAFALGAVGASRWARSSVRAGDAAVDAGLSVAAVQAPSDVRVAEGAADAALEAGTGADAGAGDASVAVVASPPPDAGRPLAPPARVPTLAPLTSEQAAILASAEAAVKETRWGEVIDWTLKPAIAQRPEAVTLRVLAACHVGDLGLVRADAARLPARRRAEVVQACAANGIDL